MKNNIFRKIFAAGIIILFIGIGIQPVFAEEPNIKSRFNREENIEPKKYLYQTIIEIANNPEVKDLVKNNAGFIGSDNNLRNVYLKILLRNPRIIFSMLFNKPSFTPEYIDSTYNKGCKIVNILGEEKANEITESLTFNNPELFEELNSIIMKNEELSKRITTLKEMKGEIKFSTASNGPVVLCVILGLILIPSFITALIYYGLAELAKDNPTAYGVFLTVYIVFGGIALGCLYLMAGLGC